MIGIRVGASWSAGPVGGQWLHGLRNYGELEVTTSLERCTDSSGGGGLLSMSWTMDTPAGVSLPPALRLDSLVEMRAGSVLLGVGYIAETPRGNSVTVNGLRRLGENFLAVDSTGVPTTNIRTAVTEAIVNGLRWRNPGDLPNSALSALSEEMVRYNTLSALLNKYCAITGQLWWIDRRGYLRIGSYPTTPKWMLAPSLPSMESADEDFASAVFVRRVDGLNADGEPNAWGGASATDPTAPFIRQTSMDLEQLGYLDAPTATAHAQAILDANRARSGFTEGVSVIRGQLQTLGGVAPEWWQVFAVDPTMVRTPNWVNSSGSVQIGRRKDWVLGGTRWKQGELLQLTPLGMVPRKVASITQAATGKPELVFQ